MQDTMTLKLIKPVTLAGETIDHLDLCEPTAGVDIGTRVAIYDLIAELSRNGLTVVLSSSDAGDVLAIVTNDEQLPGSDDDAS